MPEPRARTSPPRSAERGFSLVEVLIAAVIILIILVGVLPLFQQSRLNLMQGNDASSVTNATVDSLENVLSLPFNNQRMTLVAGTSLVATDFWLLDGNRWVTDMTPYPGDRAQFTRSTTVEQFNVDDLEFDETLDTPLPSTTPVGQVQLKRLTVDVTNARTAGTPAYRVITVQSF
jgi:prepilin-type N-terminal cleavage/methylation domain-containing protein